MRAKLMTSAAVFAGVLAFAGVSYAQSGPSGNVGGNATATDSYNSGGNADLDLGVADSFNDNSDNSTDLDVGISDSLNDNSDNSTNTDFDLGVADSLNDNSDNSTNTEVGIADSFNDNSDNSTNTDSSTNTNLELGVDIADSFNDNSTADSGNDNSTSVGIADSFNDNSQWNVRVSLNNQELSANVSDMSFDMSEDGRGPQNARIRSGDINQGGGAFAGFAGIQTVSNNTGLASVGQAATAISANANVTFGGGGGN